MPKPRNSAAVNPHTSSTAGFPTVHGGPVTSAPSTTGPTAPGGVSATRSAGGSDVSGAPAASAIAAVVRAASSAVRYPAGTLCAITRP